MTSSIATDIAVIGAGTAGVTAFHEIRRTGRSALLVDRGPLGTTCARVGCMPSKAVLHGAHHWSVARRLGGCAPAGAAADDLWRGAIATRDRLATAAAQRTRAGAGDAQGVDEGVIAARGALALAGAAVAPPPPRRTPLSIIFSDPDIATVGAAWDQLDPRSIVVGSAEGSGNGRSRILGAEDNLVRVYAERASGRIVGASLLATRGEHLAHLLAWSIQRRETVDGLLEMPYYHPSIEELPQSALQDASRQLAGLRA
jgi:pyruvate/2-oxoglutarate dehydrogenase complex dihydrolipoamide dehydrogenase (E3) component